MGLRLSADLSQSQYDWACMRVNYSGSATSYAQQDLDAVALLMRDCGYAFDMDYGINKSGAYCSADELVKHFHYSPATKNRSSDQYSTQEWHALIRRDLDRKYPVLYSGRSASGGHQFILEGYKTDGTYHVNWGWGGVDNGWFVLANMNGYNDFQNMVNNLCPDYTQDAPPPIPPYPCADYQYRVIGYSGQGEQMMETALHRLTIERKAGPAAPNVSYVIATAPTSRNGADGVVRGGVIRITMEYSTDVVTDGIIEGVSSGMVLLRERETDSVLAGEAATIVVPEYVCNTDVDGTGGTSDGLRVCRQ